MHCCLNQHACCLLGVGETPTAPLQGGPHPLPGPFPFPRPPPLGHVVVALRGGGSQGFDFLEWDFRTPHGPCTLQGVESTTSPSPLLSYHVESCRSPPPPTHVWKPGRRAAPAYRRGQRKGRREGGGNHMGMMIMYRMVKWQGINDNCC